MKKSSVIALCVILSIAVIIGGVVMYITGMPEYAMLKMAVRVSESGYDGLKPSMSETAKNKIEPILNVAESKLLQHIISLLPGKDVDDDFILEYLEEIDWTYIDILKNSKRAVIRLGFSHDSDLSGVIDIELIKLDGEWLINDFGNLKIDDWQAVFDDIDLSF